MATIFKQVTDINQAQTSIIPFSSEVDAAVLAAATSQTFTVPSDANVVLFSSTAAFYVKEGASASVPGASVNDGTAAVLRPNAKKVTPGGQITLVAPASGTVVTMEYYNIPGIDR